MVNPIIEYIGKEGVKTSPANSRLIEPKEGDVIEFPETLGYPFDNPFGRIDRLNNVFNSDPLQVHICVNLGSVFLGDGYVSISGGPFTHILKSDLKPTGKVKDVNFWNFGDHLPGAGQGVYYTIARPVFRYEPKEKVAKL